MMNKKEQVGNEAMGHSDRTDSEMAYLLKIEEALKAEKELLQTILFSIADGIIVTDQHERIFLINEAAQKLTGWSQSEATGHLFRDVYRVIHEQTRLPLQDPVHALLTNTPVTRSEQTILVSKSGRSEERRVGKEFR